MSPEQRREMIVQAAIPLVSEFGAAVTTAQVAKAAGIGEATIFRAFADKEELLRACVAQAVRIDRAVDEIAAIPLDQPLADRLVEAADALQAHLERMGRVVGAMLASGHGEPSRGRPEPGARERSMDAIREAMAGLFEPDAASLRLPPDQAAAIFMGFLFARARQDGDELAKESIVDVFLHGAVKQ
ncbi:TetR family transcriptional regulator [Labedaea rhizosphaerae]|uniref:TetR family transcriptional regulator n=2 Tax=Labedaea rhizosphaerae TaxID=598644 RepID=A0A4R6S2B4_LABRH|nr:TetR/AcrR family transcriptional regulator [Labedaea rhizosphaerae]TDP93691.1 TetR family transcriptional regulator [Labedaea rhizosphaerae]